MASALVRPPECETDQKDLWRRWQELTNDARHAASTASLTEQLLSDDIAW